MSASDPALIAFLNQKNPDWAQTQTVPPSAIQAALVSTNSVRLSWTPIPYTGDGGYYQVSYAAAHGGPYTIHGATADKRATGYLAEGLPPAAIYFFVVRTHTPAHGSQQNALWSDYSREVAAITPAARKVMLPLVSVGGR